MFPAGQTRPVRSGPDASQPRLHLRRRSYDPHKLFVIEGVTKRVRNLGKDTPKLLRAQRKALAQASPPDVEPGPQCRDPYVCEFFSYCNPDPPQNRVSYLPQTLAKALSGLKYPIYFMDFESLFPAIPRHAGMWPYSDIPFQWSVHRQLTPDAALEHFEFLADDGRDRRVEFVGSLCETLGRRGHFSSASRGISHSSHFCLRAELSCSRHGSSVPWNFSQITSIAALSAIDLSVMCGAKNVPAHVR
jgi:hypothetical protein